MFKKFLIIILGFLLTACQGNPDQGQQKNNDSSLLYPLSAISSLKEDDSLKTSMDGLDFPSRIKADENEPYKRKDLENLDYGKTINFANMYIRIPKKSKVFSNMDTYYIDLPYSPSYSIYFTLEEFDPGKDLSLEEASKLIYKDLVTSERLISKFAKNDLSNLTSGYFITQKDHTRTTHLLIKAPDTIIYFRIVEDISLSHASSAIMSDLVMGIFRLDDDPLEVNKSFKSYADLISVFVSKEVHMGDINFKIPDNFLLDQKSENLMTFVHKEDGQVVSEIIGIIQKKDGRDIRSVFNDPYSKIVYPANLVTSSRLSYENSDFPYIRSRARLYHPSLSLDGDKLVIASDSSYISLFILGPLENVSQTNLMTTSIIRSIKKD
ncbi:MAG: hypothetical protein Q4D88_00870 [Anaerococcus sp.]|nr:hypothetical protein [Anaerococcus sp.]